jgi:hypothetical protein
MEEARQEVYRCFEELAPLVDAMWLGLHNGIHAEYMPELLEPLFEHGVATWSQTGSEYVRRGVLVSVTKPDLEPLDFWEAGVIAQIFNGTRPRDIGQVFEQPNVIAINLETAERIGFEPPKGIMKVADEVYEHIETGQED